MAGDWRQLKHPTTSGQNVSTWNLFYTFSIVENDCSLSAMLRIFWHASRQAAEPAIEIADSRNEINK